jgi:hypothetical protein
MWNWIKDELHQDRDGNYWLLDRVIIKDWDTRVYGYVQVKRKFHFFYTRGKNLIMNTEILDRNVK